MMAWTCAFCKTFYARRKDHDETNSNLKCFSAEYRQLRKSHQEILLRRDLLDGLKQISMDKEINKSFALMASVKRKGQLK